MLAVVDFAHEEDLGECATTDYFDQFKVVQRDLLSLYEQILDRVIISCKPHRLSSEIGTLKLKLVLLRHF